MRLQEHGDEELGERPLPRDPGLHGFVASVQQPFPLLSGTEATPSMTSIQVSQGALVCR